MAPAAVFPEPPLRSYHELTDTERFVLRRLARGTLPVKIANVLTLSPSDVIAIRDRYPDILEQLILQITDPKDLYAPLVPKAVQAIERALDIDDRGIAAHAAQEVMDRTFGKSVVRSITETRGSITVTFKSASEPQVIEGEAISSE